MIGILDCLIVEITTFVQYFGYQLIANVFKIILLLPIAVISTFVPYFFLSKYWILADMTWNYKNTTYYYFVHICYQHINFTQFSCFKHLCSCYGSKVAFLATLYYLSQILEEHVILPTFHVWTISVAIMDKTGPQSPGTMCWMSVHYSTLHYSTLLYITGQHSALL